MLMASSRYNPVERCRADLFSFTIETGCDNWDLLVFDVAVISTVSNSWVRKLSEVFCIFCAEDKHEHTMPIRNNNEVFIEAV